MEGTKFPFGFLSNIFLWKFDANTKWPRSNHIWRTLKNVQNEKAREKLEDTNAILGGEEESCKSLCENANDLKKQLNHIQWLTLVLPQKKSRFILKQIWSSILWLNYTWLKRLIWAIFMGLISEFQY